MSARLLLCLALFSGTVALADPSGRRWAINACGGGCPIGQTCSNQRCVPVFRIAATVDNASGANSVNGGIAYSQIVSRTVASFQAWTTSRVSCNTNYNVSQGNSFTTPVGLNAVNGNDRSNNVIWLSGTSWTHLNNELALTTTTYTTNDNVIIDADMEINNNITWSDSQSPNTYDPESVIIHEAGHFAGLAHSPGSTYVMYALVNPASNKRVLTQYDQNDICNVYPGASGGQGTSCNGDTDCTSPLVCRGRPGSASKICTATCTSTCPTGFSCQAANTGMACLPQVGASDHCKFCQSGGACSTGVCLRFGDGVTFCSSTCSDNDQCPSGSSCQSNYCVPNSNTCTTQCTTNAQCATNYTCTGGTCKPNGNTGDDCSVSVFCKSCNVCTRESATTDQMYCRSCCSGTGLCNTCTSTTCGMGTSCVALASNAGNVCAPSASEPGTCQACPQGTCAQGLTCVQGRCRTECNPSAPGSCQACFGLQQGGGVCACGDEINNVGEPCGQIAQNTVAACAQGLACVQGQSGAGVCRTTCNAGAPASCGTGFTCQLVSGVGVCLPGSEGSTCAACNNAGACSGNLICYLGRCYERCNVNLSQTCGTCVQTAADGTGVCGCSDQISPEGGPCGTSPEVRSCQGGLRCIDSICKDRCDPQVPFCNPDEVCTDIGGSQFFCVRVASGGGTGTTGGGTGSSTGGGRQGGGSATGGSGGGGGAPMDLGCGCGAGGPFGAVAFGVLALLRRRRSTRQLT
ncbi:MAG: hypothetical protein DI536_11410 [Archangium gephyra]|uniref:Peptidase M10 metallopeptidase domain-containing protein n=1 Tax=Archangium gephyra TaxID=48 RepID=A0A2W5VTM7_9BACT|nr:MAG: hypothetical protein DI536_11410 [Archangium gephyra]